MDEDLSTGVACRWCRLLGSEGGMVYDDPTFVVVATPARRRGRSLTLVPRAHVNVVTELPLPEMAAVLGGLSRASDLLRHNSGGAGVQINAHPSSARLGHGHLHFQLTVQSGNETTGHNHDETSRDQLRGGSVPGMKCARAEAEGPPVFAPLADAISH